MSVIFRIEPEDPSMNQTTREEHDRKVSRAILRVMLTSGKSIGSADFHGRYPWDTLIGGELTQEVFEGKY